MHEDKVVIILTRPALERLIGGDSEVEIRLRQQAVERILEKHIIPLVASRQVQNIVSTIQTLVDEEMKKYQVSTRWWEARALTSSLKKSIEEEVDKVVLGFVKEAVAKLVTEERVENIVKRVTETYASEHVRNKIKAHLDKII